VLFAILAIATPFITLVLLAKYKKLRENLDQLAEENSKQHTSFQREVADLKRQLTAAVHSAAPVAGERRATASAGRLPRPTRWSPPPARDPVPSTGGRAGPPSGADHHVIGFQHCPAAGAGRRLPHAAGAGRFHEDRALDVLRTCSCTRTVALSRGLLHPLREVRPPAGDEAVPDAPGQPRWCPRRPDQPAPARHAVLRPLATWTSSSPSAST